MILLKIILKRDLVRRLKLYILYVLILVLLPYCLWPEPVVDEFEEAITKIRKNLGIDMTCHYKKDNDDFLPLVNKNTKFPKNSIFFIEATCSGLNARQACSVESATRANPDQQINLIFTSSITWSDYKDNIILKFLMIRNFNAMRIYIEDYVEGTAFHKKLTDKNTRNGLYMYLTDILKYLTAYKYPGIYLPLDVIIARSLNDLGANWVVKETPGSISTDIFSFSENKHGRALAAISMEILQTDVTLPEQNYENPTLMKKLIHTWCGISDLISLNSTNCPGLNVIEPKKFVPIPLYHRVYFGQYHEKQWKNKNIYGYQIWARFSRNKAISNNSLFIQLAKEYCPITYEFYEDEFK